MRALARSGDAVASDVVCGSVSSVGAAACAGFGIATSAGPAGCFAATGSLTSTSGHTAQSTIPTAQITPATAPVNTTPGCFCDRSASPLRCDRCIDVTTAARVSPRLTAASNALATVSGSMSNSFA